MSKIVTIITATTLFLIFVFFFYNTTGNKNKKLLRESLTRDVFFITFIVPLVAASLLTYLITLIFREGNTEKFYRSDVIVLLTSFYLWGVYSVSMGIHALAKAFRRHAISIKEKKLLELVRFFHGPFSHYGSNISIALILLLLVVFNTNHPSREILSSKEVIILILCGIALGSFFYMEAVLSNVLKGMKYFFIFIPLIIIYLAVSQGIAIVQLPLSITTLTIFSTIDGILIFEVLAPKKYRITERVDKKFISVNRDWTSIIGE
ncbi:MAG: hypothetical protein M1308_15260 [Actinobacteria bacterium]|nr:hypothetical protein [Actinomycetota bacterium]